MPTPNLESTIGFDNLQGDEMSGPFAGMGLFFFWILFYFILPLKAERASQQSQIKLAPIPRAKAYSRGMINYSYIAILAIDFRW
jgi:hypothetical protein